MHVATVVAGSRWVSMMVFAASWATSRASKSAQSATNLWMTVVGGGYRRTSGNNLVLYEFGVGG